MTQQRSQISTVSLRYTENLSGEQTRGCYSQIYIYLYTQIKQIKMNKTEKKSNLKMKPNKKKKPMKQKKKRMEGWIYGMECRT